MINLRRLVLASLIVAPVAAQAADLPSRVAPPVYVAPPAAVFSWTGFYIGANAGYGFGSGALTGPTGLSVPAAPVGTFAVTPVGATPFLAPTGGHRDGFVGGGQVGYNYQFGAGSGLVVGAEADFDYSALNNGSQFGGIGAAVPGGNPQVTPGGLGRGIAPIGTGLATAPGNVAFFNNARRGPGDFLGTVRGRLGYGFDRVLIYATGGFAYTAGRTTGVTGGFANGAAVPAAFYTDFAARAAGAAVGPTGAATGSTVGFVVGGGVEYAIPSDSFVNVFHSSAVTLKVEGLYFDLGHQGAAGTQVVGVSNTGAVITGTGRQYDNTFGVVRAGINFKFGSLLPEPVVARY